MAKLLTLVYHNLKGFIIGVNSLTSYKLKFVARIPQKKKKIVARSGVK